MVPRSAARAPSAALGAPLVVTGGHAWAQAPLHAEVEPWSASNRYTVCLLGPAASTLPSLPPAFTTVTLTPAATDALVTEVLAVAGDTEFDVLVLLALPQPVTRSAAKAASASGNDLFMTSPGFTRWVRGRLLAVSPRALAHRAYGNSGVETPTPCDPSALGR